MADEQVKYSAEDLNLARHHFRGCIIEDCPSCERLAALIAQVRRDTFDQFWDVVQRLRMFAERSENADWSDGINRAADELTEWLVARGIGAKQ